MEVTARRTVRFASPLILVILALVAAYAFYNIRSLSLPIPQFLALVTILLPVTNGLISRTVSSSLRRSSNNLTLRLAALIWLQIIYETAVATLALTHIVPPSALTCGLRDQWMTLYRAKDEHAIRAIQDKFECCGLNTALDMPWPFPGGKPETKPDVCSKRYLRQQGCFEPWRKSEQLNAGLLFLVAAVVFIMKALSITSLLSNNSWTRSRWVQPFRAIAAPSDEEEEDSADDNRATMRRLIEESAAGDSYHDDPIGNSRDLAPEDGGQNAGRTPRVLVSALADNSNEWRDEGHAR